MTYQSLVGGTLNCNESAMWSRNHQSRVWAISTEYSLQPAVIDDFGTLVATTWSAAA